MTPIIAIFAVLQWSGTKPATPLSYACLYFTFICISIWAISCLSCMETTDKPAEATVHLCILFMSSLWLFLILSISWLKTQPAIACFYLFHIAAFNISIILILKSPSDFNRYITSKSRFVHCFVSSQWAFNSIFSFFFFFWRCHVACGVTVPQPGIEPFVPWIGRVESNLLDRHLPMQGVWVPLGS